LRYEGGGGGGEDDMEMMALMSVSEEILN